MSTPEVFFRETIDLNRYSNSVALKYVVNYNEIILNAAKILLILLVPIVNTAGKNYLVKDYIYQPKEIILLIHILLDFIISLGQKVRGMEVEKKHQQHYVVKSPKLKTIHL